MKILPLDRDVAASLIARKRVPQTTYPQNECNKITKMRSMPLMRIQQQCINKPLITTLKAL